MLVSYLRGAEEAGALVDDAVGGDLAVASVMSRIEIEGGMRSDERGLVARMFTSLTLEPVSDLIASRAAEFMRRYRRSHQGIDIVDFVVAATADVLGAELVTLNVRHFPMFEGLEPAF